MDTLVGNINQNDRLYVLVAEFFEWMKARFAPQPSSCPSCLSRYGAQTMHVPTPDCEVHENKRRIIHIRDLVLAEGDWLMDTAEALSVLGYSRGTLDAHRRDGLLCDVTIGEKGGGLRFISSEVIQMREWYSKPKGKV